jgi:hypothetical protein
VNSTLLGSYIETSDNIFAEGYLIRWAKEYY